MAPLDTTVPRATVPSGVLVLSPVAPSFNVPAEIVVHPVKVLAPERVSVPEPDLVSAPLPANIALMVAVPVLFIV